MENLYYNLSEEEFSRSRKVLLWVFSGLFFLAGTYVLIASFILGHLKSIPPVLSTAPFGISLIVGIIAFLATKKREGLFFSIDEQKIEFRYGFFNPKRKSFNWRDISELVIPHKQKKAQLNFRDGTSYTIDLTWLQKKKSSAIRKHIYHAAARKELKIVKVVYLGKNNT